MTPGWFQPLSLAFIGLALICTLVIVVDLIRHPQRMWIMNLVWPLTALYAGPFGLWAYFGIGRESAAPGGHQPDKPFWQTILVGATHCGAGCAVGDFIAEWLVLALSFTVLGSKLLGRFVAAYLLAYVFGIFFQYFSIAPMRGLGFAEGLWAAIKADTLSLTAYEVGMFG
jgi:hypothetical protein